MVAVCGMLCSGVKGRSATSGSLGEVRPSARTSVVGGRAAGRGGGGWGRARVGVAAAASTAGREQAEHREASHLPSLSRLRPRRAAVAQARDHHGGLVRGLPRLALATRGALLL